MQNDRIDKDRDREWGLEETRNGPVTNRLGLWWWKSGCCRPCEIVMRKGQRRSDRILIAFTYRFHLTEGAGLPVARHFSVTFVPSRATTSVDVMASSMFGGTAREKRSRAKSSEKERASGNGEAPANSAGPFHCVLSRQSIYSHLHLCFAINFHNRNQWAPRPERAANMFDAFFATSSCNDIRRWPIRSLCWSQLRRVDGTKPSAARNGAQPNKFRAQTELFPPNRKVWLN